MLGRQHHLVITGGRQHRSNGQPVKNIYILSSELLQWHFNSHSHFKTGKKDEMLLSDSENP